MKKKKKISSYLGLAHRSARPCTDLRLFLNLPALLSASFPFSSIARVLLDLLAMFFSLIFLLSLF